VIAAWNEEQGIVPTLERIADQTYEGPVEVVLADNNSTDRTAERAEEAARRLGLNYRRFFEPEPGKYRALNRALAGVTTPLVVTVDADTFLQREALTYLIARVASTPQEQHVSACAGALVAENPLTNFVTRVHVGAGGARSPHEPAIALGTRHVRGATDAPATQAAPHPREDGCQR
jgi:poly-beta-1,6-N-acetyl-D-glucosamine synthase